MSAPAMQASTRQQSKRAANGSPYDVQVGSNTEQVSCCEFLIPNSGFGVGYAVLPQVLATLSRLTISTTPYSCGLPRCVNADPNKNHWHKIKKHHKTSRNITKHYESNYAWYYANTFPSLAAAARLVDSSLSITHHGLAKYLLFKNEQGHFRTRSFSAICHELEFAEYQIYTLICAPARD